MRVNKERVSEAVARLFEGGKTPLEHFGINGAKIVEVERRHPEVAKQIPMSKRVV